MEQKKWEIIIRGNSEALGLFLQFSLINTSNYIDANALMVFLLQTFKCNRHLVFLKPNALNGNKLDIK